MRRQAESDFKHVFKELTMMCHETNYNLIPNFSQQSYNGRNESYPVMGAHSFRALCRVRRRTIKNEYAPFTWGIWQSNKRVCQSAFATGTNNPKPQWLKTRNVYAWLMLPEDVGQLQLFWAQLGSGLVLYVTFFQSPSWRSIQYVGQVVLMAEGRCSQRGHRAKPHKHILDFCSNMASTITAYIPVAKASHMPSLSQR